VSYDDFIARKLSSVPPTGLTVVPPMPAGLLPLQAALTPWALRRGRCAIFADTGLGKTRIAIVWAQAVSDYTGMPVLILTPPAVAHNMVTQGAELGITVTRCREQADVRPGVNVTNYERLHLFNGSAFGGVVPDESSIIKHYGNATFTALCEAFAQTPFKLCETATPAPNDYTELGTHAEFLGICTRAEMLAEFFVHDGGDTQSWRLKGHAKHLFWRWVATWAALVRKPSDLGFDDSAYVLPPLELHEHIVPVDHSTAASTGMLFALEANTLSERRDARRASIKERVADCAARINADREQWIVWCDLNAEGDALRAAIPDSVEVRGSDDPDDKEARILAFEAGKVRVLITKPSIAGFGVNWQHCARVAFVGVTDSWEAYYQAIRRCYRFGQKRKVQVHIFASELEGAVTANIKRKERDGIAMADALSAETRDAVRESVIGSVRATNPYNASKPISAPAWLTSEAA
jgi:hypothetical protein